MPTSAQPAGSSRPVPQPRRRPPAPRSIASRSVRRADWIRRCVASAAVIAWAAGAGEPPASVVESLTLQGQVDPQQADFILKGRLRGHPEEKLEARLIYSLRAQARLDAGESTNHQSCQLEARIFQGAMKEMALALAGDGQITRVTGPALKDWSVRHGTNGARFLILRPIEPDQTTNEFRAIVESEWVAPALPATWTPLTLAPADVALFDGLLEVRRPEALEVSVSRIEGLAPLESPSGPAAPGAATLESRPLRFRFAGAPYALALDLEAADPEARRLRFEDFQLTGQLEGSHALFTLTGTAVARHAAGGQLALLGGDAALTGFPAPLDLRFTNGQYVLSMARTGSVPVRLAFAARVINEGGWKTVRFEAPPSVLRPVSLGGLPAETEFRFPGASRPERHGTNFATYLTAAGRVQWQWKDSRPEVEGRLFYAVQGAAQMAVSPGLLRQAHRMEYKIMQGELKRLEFDLAGDGEITRVQGEGVLSWSVEKGTSGRRLAVQLNQPQKDRYAIVIQAQSPLGVFPLQVQPLRLTPVDAVRFAGHLLIVNDGAVRLEVTEASGLSQISSELFPPSKELAGWLPAQRSQAFAYRFSGADFSLGVRADDIQPELSVSQLAQYHVGETETRIEAELELEIREAPLRELTVMIPSDYSVSRLAIGNLSDYFVTPGPDAGRSTLRMVFGQPLSGRQVAQIRLERNQDLATNTWILPALAVPGAKSVRGFVGVTADTGLRVQAGELAGMTEIATAFFPRKSAGLQLAYRLREPLWQAALRVDRLALSLQVDAFHLFTVGEGLAYGSSVLNYQISGSPVSLLSIQAPAEYSNLEFVGRDVRNWKKTDSGFEVHLQSPVFGAYTLLATYDRKFNAAGDRVDFTGIRPAGVQSEQGSVVVVSEYPFELEPSQQSSGMTRLDPGEIPASQRLLFDAPILAAYQYPGRPFALQLELKSLAQGETVQQVVDRAALESRISKEGEVVTHARYFVKSKGHSHFRLTMPEDARLWEARVHGARVVPVADAKDTLIPLPTHVDPSTILPVEVWVAARSADRKRVTVRLPVLASAVVLSEWNLIPDEAHRLIYRRGTLAPADTLRDNSGFAWILHRIRGGFDSDWAIHVALSLGALLAGALLLRWASGAGAYRCSARNLIGTVLGAAAIVAGVFLVVLWMKFAWVHPLKVDPQLTLAAPIQAAGQDVSIEMRNLPLKDFEPSAWSLWPALLGGLLWLYLSFKFGSGWARFLGAMVGWVFVAWAALRLPNGAPYLGGLVLLFCAWYVVIPAVRAQWTLPRRPAPPPSPEPPPEPAPAAGAVAALLAAGLGLAGIGAPPAQAAEARPGQAVIQVLEQDARVIDGHVQIKARAEMTGLAGATIDLLRAPAVLIGIDYPKASLQLFEARPDGQAAHRVAFRQPGRFQVEFTYQVDVTAEPGTNHFVLPTAGGLVNRLALELDRAEVEVFSPRLVAVRTGRVQREGAEVARAELVLEPAGGAWIGWRPRGRDTQSEKPVFYAELHQLYIPTAGAIEGWHDVQIRLAQGQLSEVAFQAPTGLTIADVQADGLAGWRFDPDTRALQVEFQSPQSRPFALRLLSQQIATPLPYEQNVGVIVASKAAGQVGMVGLATGPEVQLDRTRETNLSAINLEDFPDGLVKSAATNTAGLTLRRAFRYTDAAARIAIAAAAVQPDVRVATQETLSLGEDRTLLAIQMNAAITRAGIFKFSFPLPADFEVESLSGPALSHWTELAAGGERIVTLHLKGKTEGDQAMAITLSGPGIARGASWEAPRFAVREANKQSGQLVIVPELGLRLHVDARDGVTQLDPQKAGVPQKGVLAFRLLHARWRLHFEVETVEPWIEAALLEDVAVQESGLVIQAQLDYQIENAGLKALTLALPAQAENVRFYSEHVADTRRLESSDPAMAEWELKLQRRVIGAYPLRVTFQLPAAAGATNATVPGLVARAANVQRGYVTVRSAGRLQVQIPSLPATLQRSEWQAIPPSLRGGLAAAEAKETFRVLDPAFRLPIQITRHEVAPLLPARVEGAELASVVSASHTMLTEVRLTLQPGDKRLLRVKLPAHGRFWYAFVNQESAWPWQEGEEILLKLERNSDSACPTTVEFFYTCPLPPDASRGFTHRLPGPKFDLPLERIRWRVYVPRDWEIEEWQSTLERQLDGSAAAPVRLDLERYLESESVRQREKTRAAETLLELGNSYVQQGVPVQARRAYQAAWRLSQHDAAFNEDARVQWHNLKMQQALLGLNDRQAGAAAMGERGPAAALPAAPGLEAYKQDQVEQILGRNTPEDNANLLRLAERLIRQQEAAVARPSAIHVSLPALGQPLQFAGSLQVDPWADLQIQLDARVRTPRLWFGRLALLAGLFVICAILAAAGRRVARAA